MTAGQAVPMDYYPAGYMARLLPKLVEAEIALAPQTNRPWTPGAIGNRVPLSAKARDDEESTIITLAAVSPKIHQIA